MREKHKTRFWQKVLLVFFGLVLTELILHVAGWAYLVAQKSQTNFDVSDNTKPQIILCVGESTTAWSFANSYPSLLQKKLNKIYGDNKYRVLNEGLAGSNTEVIADALPGLVSRYRPSIVVTMMGINDAWTLEGSQNLTKYFKIYKLYELIKYNLQNIIEEKKQENDILEWKLQQDRFILELPDGWGGHLGADFLKSLRNQQYDQAIADTEQLLKLQSIPDNFIFDAALTFLRSGDETSAEKYFSQYLKSQPTTEARLRIAKLYLFFLGVPDKIAQQEAMRLTSEVLQVDPKNAEALGLLGCILQYRGEAADRAQHYLEQAIQYGNRDGNVILVLAGVYQKKQMMKQAEETLVLGLNDSEVGVYVWGEYVRTLYWEENWTAAEAAANTALERYPSNRSLLDLKAQVLSAQGKQNLPDGKNASYWKHHFLLNTQTRKNYLTVTNYLKSRGVIHVAMQYPLRDIAELRELLKDYPNVIFVENRKNFLAAEKDHSFAELFNDHFAEDFGHFSPLGAELVAEQLVLALQEKAVLPPVTK